jgi:cytochrome b
MKTIKVWDLFIRFFHWALVILVIIQLVTAENFKAGHVKAGYIIIALLILRIIWGFVGSRYARFSDFIYPLTDIFAYLKGLVLGRPRHYTGHNPAGGAMVCALLLALGMTTLTGVLTHKSHTANQLTLLSGQVVHRAWADDDDDDDDDHRQRPQRRRNGSHFWKEIHEALVGITLFLIAVHICGVLASSYVHRENLIWSMFTGKKRTYNQE